MTTSPTLLCLAMLACAPAPNPDCNDLGWADLDGDGWGDPDHEVARCDDSSAGVTNALDCDDADERVGPGADERCNDADDDCDGMVDEQAVDAPTWFGDGDRDGLGQDGVGIRSCDQPPGTANRSGDCDDADPDVGLPMALHRDDDTDGFGDAATATTRCPEAGWVGDDTDCDDAEDSVYPGAPARCDGLDNDCDELLEEDAVVPDDGPLQDVVDAAADDAWICIRPGTYAPLYLEERSVTLEGMADGVTLVGAGGQRPLTVSGGALALTGVTLSGGYVSGGGGGALLDDGTHALTDVAIAYNRATASGGGLYAEGAEVTLTRVHVHDNQAPSGAGMLFSNVDLTARGLRTSRNIAENGSTSHLGGGIATILANDIDIAGWVSVEDAIEDDRAGSEARGGALYLQGSGTVRNSVFIGTRALADTIRGGVIHLDRGVTLENVTIHDVGCPGVGVAPTGQSCGIHAGPDTSVTNVTLSTVLGPWGAVFAQGATLEGVNVHDASAGAIAPGSDPFAALDVDPGFVDVASEDRTTWDLHLTGSSNLVDAGVDTGGDLDGSPTDIGAYGGPGASDLD